MNDEIVELSGKIRDRRRRLGLTQQEVGDLAGVSDLFVRELEKGKPTVRLELVLAVARVLGLKVALVDRTADHEG